MPKKVFSRKSLTLSELLLAAVILVVALSAILIEFIACGFLNDSSRNTTRAITHAQQVMEEIKNETFANVKTEINNGDWDWNTTTINSEGLTALKNEAIDTRVSGTTLLTISTTVSWEDRNGRGRTVSLETLWAEP